MSSDPFTNAGPDLSGTRLGKYALRERLGRGGMGDVYLAYDPALDRTVAVKVLAPHLVWQQEFVERFLREARAAARLNHPNIVTIYDVGQDSGWYYFVMEYLEGRPLTELLKSGVPLPLGQVQKILTQVADALDYAHNFRGLELVHRDVKPGNVMVAPDGRVTLTDFGIARAGQETRLTIDGQVLGTPAYMSPEQALGHPVGKRSDQYALAVIAYEMLTGRVPFAADSTPALMYQVVHMPPPPLSEVRPDLPAAAERALGRALAKNPGERYESCGEFVAALGPALVESGRGERAGRVAAATVPIGRGAPVTSPPDSTAWHRLRSFAAQRVLLLAGVAAVAVSLALGGTALARRAGRESGQPVITPTRTATNRATVVTVTPTPDTPTVSATLTGSPSPSPSPTATETGTPTGTPTGTASPTATRRPTDTPTPTATCTPTPTPTRTATPTNTWVPTPTSTWTPPPTWTPTNTPSPDSVEPGGSVGLVLDNMESYGSNADVKAVYWANGNWGEATCKVIVADPPHTGEGARAMGLKYVLGNAYPDDYCGFELQSPWSRNWSGHSQLCMWMETGPGRELVVQFDESGGERWKTSVPLSSVPRGLFCLQLSTSQFWQVGSGNGRIDLDAVKNYGIYVNGPLNTAGVLYVDYIHLR